MPETAVPSSTDQGASRKAAPIAAHAKPGIAGNGGTAASTSMSGASAPAQPPDGAPLPSRRPWWLGLAVMFLGAVCVHASTSLEATAQYAAIGPGLFVLAIGIGLLALGGLLLLQIARGETFEALDAENASAQQPMDRRAFATALLAVALPALIMAPLGLPVTAMLAFMLVARAFGSRRMALDLLAGFLLGSISWLLFGWLGLQLGGFFPPLGG